MSVVSLAALLLLMSMVTFPMESIGLITSIVGFEGGEHQEMGSELGLPPAFSGENPTNLDWSWAVKGSGGNYNAGEGIVVDSSGNSYIVGYFRDTATFGTQTLTSSGETDVFVAKLSYVGDWVWAIKVGGSDFDYSYDIALDPSDNILISGYFTSSSISFGSTTLTNSGQTDVYVAKLSQSGSWLWAVKAGGSSSSMANGIAVDAAGNAYVVGQFGGTMTFDEYSLSSSGDYDVFVAKVSGSGTWQWALRAGGTEYDYGQGIATDSSANIYITGYFFGTANFGNNAVSSSGTTDIFVAKIESSEISWEWAVKGGGSSGDKGNSIAVDASGNSYVTGVFSSQTSVFGEIFVSNQDSDDIFVAKVSDSGTWEWATSAGADGAEAARSIVVDTNGNTYVTGNFFETADFGNISLSSNGAGDIFIASLSSSGSWQWAISAGGSDWDNGEDIALDSDGYAHITGYFKISATFGEISLSGSSDKQPFVAGVNEFEVGGDGDTSDPGAHLPLVSGVSVEWVCAGLCPDEQVIYVQWEHSTDVNVVSYHVYVSESDFTNIRNVEIFANETVQGSNGVLINVACGYTCEPFVGITVSDGEVQKEEGINTVRLEPYNEWIEIIFSDADEIEDIESELIGLMLPTGALFVGVGTLFIISLLVLLIRRKNKPHTPISSNRPLPLLPAQPLPTPAIPLTYHSIPEPSIARLTESSFVTPSSHPPQSDLLDLLNEDDIPDFEPRSGSSVESLADTLVDSPVVASGGKSSLEMRFSVGELLAEGGMAQVFNATEKATGQTVIWKQAYGKHNPLSVSNRKLADEAELLQFVRHPRIPVYLAHGEVTDRKEQRAAVLVQEFIEGGDLKLTVEQVSKVGASINRAKVIEYLVAICEPLEHMAELAEPVYHRDMKPHNIIVHPDRGPVLIDFGLAKMVASGEDVSITRGGSGTWTPPERDAGVSGSFTDVYSLGKILFYLLTNESPPAILDAENVAAVTAAGHPRWLADLVLWAAWPQHLKRIQTVQQFRVLLENEGQWPEGVERGSGTEGADDYTTWG